MQKNMEHQRFVGSDVELGRVMHGLLTPNMA